MTALVFSPLADPTSWTLSVAGRTFVPPGLRYTGYGLRALRAVRGTAAEVRAPTAGILRRVPGVGVDAGKTVVELQVNPLRLRRIGRRLPWGVPTFYFVLDPATLGSFSDDDTATAEDRLATASEVVILLAGQDRTSLDPALWAQQIGDAITAAQGDTSSWQPFASRVQTQTNTGATAPVIVLDHAGRLAENATLDLVFGAPGAETVHRVTMVPSDGGDLQKTVARLNAPPGNLPIANLWGSATSFRLRPVLSTSPSGTAALPAMQLARVEDRVGQAGEIEVTPAKRHIALTDLNAWFAPQYATPTGASQPALERFTRGNLVRTFVNGPEYFRDLFTTLPGAAAPGGELHLAGWSMVPDVELIRRLPTDSLTLPITLEDAAKAISGTAGRCRFLPSQMMRLDPNAPLKAGEFWVFYLIVVGILVLGALGIAFVTDGSGAFILFALIVANPFVMSLIFDSGGRPLEQNAKAIDTLKTAQIAGSSAHFSPYPAQVADNTASPPLTGFPYDALVGAILGFGVHHQKLAVVKTIDGMGDAGFVGYCGGIDLWPDRLDDERHLAPHPFHDVHARVEGPAVRDLARSFKERWDHDVPGEQLDAVPAASAFGTPGKAAVQVARTYFAAAAPARAFPFAPAGDRTIANTMLRAIAQAREFIYIEDQYFTPPSGYQSALVSKVASGDIHTLLVTIPGLADQPFGEIVRDPFIAALRAADAGRGIVRVGYPRLHFSVPENELRASSGRCLLREAVPSNPGLNPTIALGPVARLPKPPFWVAVEGELMYIYDEASGGDASKRFFKVERGDDTRFLRGGIAPKGVTVREHPSGAAATVLDFHAVYVHAKMMIVDDVFLGVGSANLNRRGLFHDSEINIFVVPEALRHDAGNPVSDLRRRLWAEMLDLPRDLAAPLLDDPRAAARLFDRSPFAGNRYTPIDAFPAHLMFGATTGDGLAGTALQLGIASKIIIPDHRKLFDALIDPSSATESAP
jgi:phosphatidylserine/phosphatidylglycerophosphate/cardiolipin synthase-like enzyme